MSDRNIEISQTQQFEPTHEANGNLITVYRADKICCAVQSVPGIAVDSTHTYVHTHIYAYSICMYTVYALYAIVPGFSFML